LRTKHAVIKQTQILKLLLQKSTSLWSKIFNQFSVVWKFHGFILRTTLSVAKLKLAYEPSGLLNFLQTLIVMRRLPLLSCKIKLVQLWFFGLFQLSVNLSTKTDFKETI